MVQPVDSMADKRTSNTTRKFLTGAEVRVWRLAHGFSYSQAGEQLGVSAQAVALYEKSGIGRKEALALAAINAGLEPYQPTEADERRARLNKAIGL